MRVLVTGAGSGIGRATAAVLAAHGHHVVATARRRRGARRTRRWARLALDVTDDASVAACVAAAGDIDVLVNNAGISETGPIETFPHDVLARMFETNVFGPMRLVRALVPAIRERGRGVVVNVTSVEGRVAAPLAGPYCATKHALEALSESLAFEVGHFGVRVVIVEPGYIAPGMRNAGPPRRGGHRSTRSSAASGAAPTTPWWAPTGDPAPSWWARPSPTRSTTPTPRCGCRWAPTPRWCWRARRDLTTPTSPATMREVLGITW